MRISDWSSDVCSSDLSGVSFLRIASHHFNRRDGGQYRPGPSGCDLRRFDGSPMAPRDRHAATDGDSLVRDRLHLHLIRCSYATSADANARSASTPSPQWMFSPAETGPADRKSTRLNSSH